MTAKVTDSMRMMVKNMCRIGMPHERISQIVGMAPKTLRSHFREELDYGSDLATSQVSATLFELATGGNVAACIFWMKARAGWSEKLAIVDGEGDNILPVTAEEREDLARRMAYALTAGNRKKKEEPVTH